MAEKNGSKARWIRIVITLAVIGAGICTSWGINSNRLDVQATRIEKEEAATIQHRRDHRDRDEAIIRDLAELKIMQRTIQEDVKEIKGKL